MPSVSIPAAVAGITASVAGSVTAGAAAIGIGEVTAGVIGSVVGTGLVGAVGGAGLGALGAAVTGQPIGRGALTGGLTGAIGGGLIGGFGGAGGALTGALGSETAANAVLGAGAGALGSAATGGNPLQGAIFGGIGGGLTGYLDPAGGGQAALDAVYGPSGVSDNAAFGGPPIPPGDPGGPALGAPGGPISANTDVIPNSYGSAGAQYASTADATRALGTDQGYPDAPPPRPAGSPSPLNAQSAQAASGSGSGSSDSGSSDSSALSRFLNSKTGGISNGALAMGALSALSSVFNKPQISTNPTPGPSSTAANQGPFFNQPLALMPPGAGRQTVTPANVPNYYTYGQIPGGANYFANNSLAAYGFARGGALAGAEREFRDGSGNHRVRGPGTETSDSIPARLSNNEYVLDAGDVRRIGGGSADRGARILDRERRKLTRGGGALTMLGRAA